ncbi:MAG TPA: hypothetical protein ENK48_01535, partial [Gammaproteobacteria bacterium]|nr:hypothetical protein [Gammaproteobacteria bacterium]
MSRTAVARSLLGALLAVSCLGWPGIGRAAIELNVGLSGSPGTTTSPVVVVERVELSFPNRRPSQTVNRDETGFYAEARFVYKGNGPLTIRWLVDGRVLVQQTEMLTFGQTLLVRSNANGIDLPTFQPGIHRVTLELVNDTASGGGLSIPTISYLVADGAGPSGVPLALELARPAGTSTFDAATGDFRWNASKGFSVFRVEVERQSSSRAGGYRSVLAADVPGTSYAPPATDRQRFTAGPHRWRVTGFPADSSRPPVRTPWRSFFVRGGVAKGGVFLSRAALAGSAVPAGNGRVTDTLQASRALKSRGVLAPGQNYLNLRLENSGVMRQGGLAVEVYRDGTLVSRNNLAELSAGRFMDLAVPVDIPLRESAGTFSVRIVRAGGQLDEAEVEFVNPFAFQMGRIDFTERAEPVDPSFGFDPGFSGCGGALGAP